MKTKKLVDRIGFVEASIAEEQNKTKNKISNFYLQGLNFLEDKIRKISMYKSTKEVQLVDSVLTEEGLRYLGSI